MIAPIFQRLTDYRRERRIARLGVEISRALNHDCRNLAIALWRQRWDQIKARSPAQLARMDRRARKAVQA